MCTVLLRLDPAADWPLLLAAVRDELTDRPWEPPGEYWPQEAPGLVGGRDRLAGGTWLAVRGGPRPGVAAVLNGSFMNRLEQAPPGSPPSSTRPSRGRLPLQALTAGVPDAAELRAYEVVHLLVADADGARLVSWDGHDVTDVEIPPGDHIITNEGLDVAEDPLVPHFAPLLGRAGRPAVADDIPGEPIPHAATAEWWGDWVDLVRGDGLAEDDPRALLVRHDLPDGRVFGSTSATLLALGREPGQVRMDFTGTPSDPDWKRVEI
ncbi:NRDE family protein [Myceligenerans pegani]|uniref:NRDE family protein n=1 Tax=Myceligenerans pegani TaxID=2776917 RepID=A0ABR9MZJ6_9MICO|nr:NRDE family protein [Myceligenerans sp. TRM 65318]MBE1876825.1 NRDE family protein [Myceligenerans sp. TRM 65318]MBE3019096.1 NRDE family protein [Myceligenerans sp. TRM 65318]